MGGNVVRPSAFNRVAKTSESADVSANGFKDLSWEKDLQIVQLRAIEAELQTDLDEKKRQLEIIQANHAEEQAEVQRVRTLLSSNDAQIEAVKVEFNRKLARMTDQVWAKDIEVKTLISDLDQTSIRLRQSESQRLELETRFQTSTMQLAEASRELAWAHQRFNELEADAKDHDESNQVQLASLKVSHAEETQRLTVEISNAQKQVHRLEIERERLVAEVNVQSSAVKNLRERADSLQSEIDQRNSSRTYELSRTTEEYSVAIAKIAEQHNYDIQQLQKLSANEKQGLLERAARQLQQTQDESTAQIASLKAMYEAVLSGSKETESKFTVQVNRLREQSIAQMRSIEELGLKNHELQRCMLVEKSAHAAMSEELTRKRQLMASLVDEIECLRASKALLAKELAAEKIEKDVSSQEVAHLAKTLQAAQESAEALETDLADVVEKLSGQAKELAQNEAVRAGALREIEILSKQVQEQAAVIEAGSTETRNVRKTLVEEQNLRQVETAQARRDADESAGKLSELQIRIRSVEFELTSVREKLTLRQIEFENERTSLNERISVLNLNVAQRETEISELKSELRAVIADHESKYEQQTHEMHAKARDLNADKAKLESRLQIAIESVSNLECRIVALNNQSVEQMSRQAEAEAKLKSEVDQARVALRLATAETDRVRAEGFDAIRKQKIETDGAMAKLGESYQQRIEKEEREVGALKKKLASQSVQAEAAERANETRSTEIAQREEQLRQYANFVTDQKAELVRQTRKLAEEIEMTGRMHPLRDYLELTEFELSKTEVQLKVTPTLSMDRARLEAQIVQLTEQRQFLRSVIEAASQRLSEQAAGILALVNSPSLGATPPIPPKMKSTTEGASPAPTPTVVVPIKRPLGLNSNS